MKKVLKKNLKYLIAVMLIGSIIACFLPIVQIEDMELSYMQILKMSFGFYNDSADQNLLFVSMRAYLKQAAQILAVVLAILLPEILAVVLTKRKTPYIIAIIAAIINCLGFSFGVFRISKQIEIVQNILVQVGEESAAELAVRPLLIWILIQLVIICLALIGIMLWGEAKEEDAFEIPPVEAEPINMDSHISRERRKTTRNRDRHSGNRDRYPKAGDAYSDIQIPYSGKQESKQMNRDMWSGNQGMSQRPQRQNSNIMANAMQPKPQEFSREFSGMILGESGIYEKKAYRLKDKKEVFLEWSTNHVTIHEYEEEKMDAGIYYISEYGEYCAEPFVRNMIFLESGQPLGAGRKYYLPRGTRIYVKNRENMFTLA